MEIYQIVFLTVTYFECYIFVTGLPLTPCDYPECLSLKLDPDDFEEIEVKRSNPQDVIRQMFSKLNKEHAYVGQPLTNRIFKEKVPLEIPSCYSQIYCQGPLLDTIQMARPFEDSKTFVDMKMLYDEQIIQKNFHTLMQETGGKPTTGQVSDFVRQNFEDGNELETWMPNDYENNPPFLKEIQNSELKNFSTHLVHIWPTLGRKIKNQVYKNPDKYSIITVPNGFIVPGGRFREFYYWDSYWIIEGLLICGMTETARGMIENLLSMVERFGFVPNGGRIYYLNRSQPPMLSLIIDMYISVTGDLIWLAKYVDLLDNELSFWLNNKTTPVRKNGVVYHLAHYDVHSPSPRPESYSEDVKTCSGLKNSKKIDNCYSSMKSGAETGWDFSSRWLFGRNLTYIRTQRVIPVDLNSFLCKAFKTLAKFYEQLGQGDKYEKWMEKHNSWLKSIDYVLYSKKDRIWYDFDLETSQHRAEFFPSNFAPLWADLYEGDVAKKIGDFAASYLKKTGVLKYQGGIPTTMAQTGEQWDLPNAWAPLQSLVVMGLERSKGDQAKILAKELADRWLTANMIGLSETNEMFEKYDAINIGKRGRGGEYEVQTGFGWTNGVALEFIVTFYT